MLYEGISNLMPKNAKLAAFVVNVVNFSSLTCTLLAWCRRNPSSPRVQEGVMKAGLFKYDKPALV